MPFRLLRPFLTILLVSFVFFSLLLPSQGSALTLCKNTEDVQIFINPPGKADTYKHSNCPLGYREYANKEIDFSDTPLTMDFMKTDISEVIRTLSHISNTSIIFKSDINIPCTLIAKGKSVDAVLTQLLIQFDLALEINAGFVSISKRSDLVKRPQKVVVKPPPQKNIWEEPWSVDFQHVPIQRFIQEVNQRTGATIQVEDGIERTFTLKGTASTKKILRTVLQKTQVKLVRKNGRYLVEKIPQKQASSTEKKLVSQICDVYLHNGKEYLQHTVTPEEDGSISVSNGGLHVRFPYGTVRLVDNCRVAPSEQ